jgi:hypothetical protein
MAEASFSLSAMPRTAMRNQYGPSPAKFPQSRIKIPSFFKSAILSSAAVIVFDEICANI